MSNLKLKVSEFESKNKRLLLENRSLEAQLKYASTSIKEMKKENRLSQVCLPQTVIFNCFF